MTETKLFCKLLKNDLEAEAFLHLMEHRYDESITFWNAVMELTMDEMAKLPSFEAGSSVEVVLEDGRTGVLVPMHIHVRNNYYQVAAVGWPHDAG